MRFGKKILLAASAMTLAASGIGVAHATKPNHFVGTNGDDTFPGYLVNGHAYWGNDGYDQINYEGYAYNYIFLDGGNGFLHVYKSDGQMDLVQYFEGMWFEDEQSWRSVDDLIANGGSLDHVEVVGSTSVDQFSGSNTGQSIYYGGPSDDQVDYQGASTDYVFEEHPSGLIKVTKPNGGYDMFDSIESVWFQGDQYWSWTADLITTGNPSTHAEEYGTSGQDVFQGSLTGQTIFYGYDEYDQIDYPGGQSDYTFELQASGQVFVTKASGEYDILDSIEGIWFQGEGVWKSIEELTTGSGGGTPTHTEVHGTSGEDVFSGLLTGQTAYFGYDSYDQIDYEGYTSDYVFEEQTDGTVTVTKPNYEYDIMDSIEGIWFQDEQVWSSVADLLSGGSQPPSHVEEFGTSGEDTFQGQSTGQYAYYGYDAYDQVDYPGYSSEYTFELQSGGEVFVYKLSGEYDILDSIEGIWFQGEEVWSSMDDLVSGGGGGSGGTGQLEHFGVPVTLVGANMAWSESSRYSIEIGTPTINLSGIQQRLGEVESAGGNSIRIWLHTTGHNTPNIQTNGVVTSLSDQVSDQVVIDQLETILDEAWARGILVTFSLFSFDMLCDEYGDDWGYQGVWQMESHRTMLVSEYQSYIDNALIPMVQGVKDHPAMFAWEVFNEPEGMISSPGVQSGIEESTWCPATYPLSLNAAQLFVNRVAAAIHAADPNVKVTSSTHTDFYNHFSNATLTSLNGSDPAGTLDFYELHFYDNGYSNPPYATSASVYNADRPIIIGEYYVHEVPSNPGSVASLSVILDQGYAGAWPWSLATNNVGDIQNAISYVSPERRSLDQSAVEACIANQPSSCYNQ